MPAKKANPPRVGEISPEGSDGIPIYGIGDVDLTRSTRWEITNTGPQSVYVLKWEGDDPVEFAVNFELVAGVTAKDRDELYEYMKIWHSMASHQINGDDVKPPPPCTLIFGEYINCKGIVRSANAKAKGPWGGNSNSGLGQLKPTAVVFSCTFIVAPGYNGDLVEVSQQNEATSNSSVKDKFYKV